MSEDNELFDNSADDEMPDVHDDSSWSDESAARFTPDPGTIAFLDQEAAAFAEIEAQFTDTYGFTHKCKCDADYSAGNVVEVTECFAGMIVESLETCARLTTENKALKEMLTVMFRLNDELVDTNSGAVPSDTEVTDEVQENPWSEQPYGDIDGLTDDGTPV